MLKYKCTQCGNIKNLLINHNQLPVVWERCTDQCMWSGEGTKGPRLYSVNGEPTGFFKRKFEIIDPPPSEDCDHDTLDDNNQCLGCGEDCCDHDDVCEDNYNCLICGKDLTEEYAARAYDRAKDFWKYGE